MSGHDVWALQINLNNWCRSNGVKPIEETGNFQGGTAHVVRVFQRRTGLTIDGLAGTTTQRYLALRLLRPFQSEFIIPLGIMRGIVEGETGWAVGAVNWQVPGGVDCGWAQIRVLDGSSDDDYFLAFNGDFAFKALAKRLRFQKDRYYLNPAFVGAKTHENAWKYGILYWNWQSAADRYALGYKDWNYMDTWYENGVRKQASRRMSEPAMWVQAVGIPGVITGHDWSNHYITSKTSYVKKYTQ